jgi:hypothetical protein
MSGIIIGVILYLANIFTSKEEGLNQFCNKGTINIFTTSALVTALVAAKEFPPKNKLFFYFRNN